MGVDMRECWAIKSEHERSMIMCGQEKHTMPLKVQTFRRIPNPYLKLGNGDNCAEMHIVIRDVRDIPDGVAVEANPREQKITTNIAKKLKESLLNTAELDFYLLNRGILFSAKDISDCNPSNEMAVSFEDSEVHGNVDGGHTGDLVVSGSMDLDQQFVKIEILTGTEGISRALLLGETLSSRCGTSPLPNWKIGLMHQEYAFRRELPEARIVQRKRC